MFGKSTYQYLKHTDILVAATTSFDIYSIHQMGVICRYVLYFNDHQLEYSYYKHVIKYCFRDFQNIQDPTIKISLILYKKFEQFFIDDISKDKLDKVGKINTYYLS